MGALGCTQRTRGRRRVGSALQWQGGRREREKEEREKEREKQESDESDNAVEGSEEYFDESKHVDGFAAEERSSDGEEVDESEGEDGSCQEGSDFAVEEGYEEGGPDAEEGYEEVWDEV